MRKKNWLLCSFFWQGSQSPLWKKKVTQRRMLFSFPRSCREIGGRRSKGKLKTYSALRGSGGGIETFETLNVAFSKPASHRCCWCFWWWSTEAMLYNNKFMRQKVTSNAHNFEGWWFIQFLDLPHLYPNFPKHKSNCKCRDWKVFNFQKNFLESAFNKSKEVLNSAGKLHEKPTLIWGRNDVTSFF